MADKPSIEALRKVLYEQEDEFSQREFDCLVYLVNDGTINTWEGLAEYGVEVPVDI